MSFHFLISSHLNKNSRRKTTLITHLCQFAVHLGRLAVCSLVVNLVTKCLVVTVVDYDEYASAGTVTDMSADH